MRVAVAEDNQFYRAGVIKLLEAAGAHVVHEAASGHELLARLAGGDLPDVVILDLRMAGSDDEGLQAAGVLAVEYPGIGVLVLSAFAEAPFAEKLFAAGSAGKGYMLKDSLNNVTELREALARIHEGRTYCDPQIVDLLLARSKASAVRAPRTTLTPRETAVLSLLASGASNAAIATKTRSSVGATEAAISAMYNKLGIPDSPDHNRRVLVVLEWLRRHAASP